MSMKQLLTAIACVGCLLVKVSPAKAQLRYSIGPQVGLNIATARFIPDEFFQRTIPSSTSYRSGWEAGLQVTVERAHLQGQLAVLFSQKGYELQGLRYDVVNSAGVTPVPYEFTCRLNYLTLPLNLAYTQHPNGQGFQVFTGPYLGLLLGGNYTFSEPTATTYVQSGQISGGVHPTNFNGFTDSQYYSQRVDAGLQAGLGYRMGAILLRATYSLGLRNLAPADFERWRFIGTGPDYRSQVLQASIAYQFQRKS
jgi:hypothetical protein